MFDGEGATGEATSVGDGISVGVGLSDGVSVGLGLASTWPTPAGVRKDRRYTPPSMIPAKKTTAVTEAIPIASLFIRPQDHSICRRRRRMPSDDFFPADTYLQQIG